MHERICDILKKKDFIFRDLVDLAEKWGISFVAHASLIPGVRWWGVPFEIKADAIGRLQILKIHKIILVPYDDILKTESDRKNLFLKEFELSHELGHLAVFETEDLTELLNCPFIRLFPQRTCPYMEIRACEEGIKILEDIMEKYDQEIRSKQKLKKFFQKIYLAGEYRGNFSGECAVSMAKDNLRLEIDSVLGPVANNFKEALIRLNPL